MISFFLLLSCALSRLFSVVVPLRTHFRDAHCPVNEIELERKFFFEENFRIISKRTRREANQNTETFPHRTKPNQCFDSAEGTPSRSDRQIIFRVTHLRFTSFSQRYRGLISSALAIDFSGVIT